MKTTYKNWRWAGNMVTKNLGIVGPGVENPYRRTERYELVVSKSTGTDVQVTVGTEVEMGAVIASIKYNLDVSVTRKTSTTVGWTIPVYIPARRVAFPVATVRRRVARGTFVQTDMICNKVFKTGPITVDTILGDIIYGFRLDQATYRTPVKDPLRVGFRMQLGSLGNVGRAEPATWQLDASFVAQVSSTQIPMLVFEAACSSGPSQGAPITGRMVVDVAYMRGVVSIDVQVTPLGGDQECQLVPTPYVVELREPLGDRVLVDANARTP